MRRDHARKLGARSGFLGRVAPHGWHWRNRARLLGDHSRTLGKCLWPRLDKLREVAVDANDLSRFSVSDHRVSRLFCFHWGMTSAFCHCCTRARVSAEQSAETDFRQRGHPASPLSWASSSPASRLSESQQDGRLLKPVPQKERHFDTWHGAPRIVQRLCNAAVFFESLEIVGEVSLGS